MEEAEISLDIERLWWERERRDGRDREKEEPREGRVTETGGQRKGD